MENLKTLEDVNLISKPPPLEKRKLWKYFNEKKKESVEDFFQYNFENIKSWNIRPFVQNESLVRGCKSSDENQSFLKNIKNLEKLQILNKNKNIDNYIGKPSNDSKLNLSENKYNKIRDLHINNTNNSTINSNNNDNINDNDNDNNKRIHFPCQIPLKKDPYIEQYEKDNDKKLAFLNTIDYRVEKGGDVFLYLYGVINEGNSIELIVTDFKPYFYVKIPKDWISININPRQYDNLDISSDMIKKIQERNKMTRLNTKIKEFINSLLKQLQSKIRNKLFFFSKKKIETEKMEEVLKSNYTDINFRSIIAIKKTILEIIDKLDCSEIISPPIELNSTIIELKKIKNKLIRECKKKKENWINMIDRYSFQNDPILNYESNHKGLDYDEYKGDEEQQYIKIIVAIPQLVKDCRFILQPEYSNSIKRNSEQKVKLNSKKKSVNDNTSIFDNNLNNKRKLISDAEKKYNKHPKVSHNIHNYFNVIEKPNTIESDEHKTINKIKKRKKKIHSPDEQSKKKVKNVKKQQTLKNYFQNNISKTNNINRNFTTTTTTTTINTINTINTNINNTKFNINSNNTKFNRNINHNRYYHHQENINNFERLNIDNKNKQNISQNYSYQTRKYSYETRKSYEMFEANIPFVNRFLIDQKLVTSSWIEISNYTLLSPKKPKPNKNGNINGNINGNAKENGSFAQIQIQTNYKNICIAPKKIQKIIPPLWVMGFDIECEPKRDGKFPTADQDRVLDICCCLYRTDQPNEMYEYGFSMGRTYKTLRRTTTKPHIENENQKNKAIFNSSKKSQFENQKTKKPSNKLGAIPNSLSVDSESDIKIMNREVYCFPFRNIDKINQKLKDKRLSLEEERDIRKLKDKRLSLEEERDIRRLKYKSLSLEEEINIRKLKYKPLSLEEERDIWEFNNESEMNMLQSFCLFINAIDPDIITGYNIYNFDFPYLVKRAEQFNLNSFDFIGRSKKMKSYLEKRETYSKQRGKQDTNFLKIYGRMQFDLYPIVVGDMTVKLRGYSLNSVSQAYLNRQKEKINAAEIRKLYMTRKGITETVNYCFTDARLPCLLLCKLNYIIKNIQLARITHIDVQSLLDRGQQIRGFISILYECKYNEGKQYFVPTKINLRNDNDDDNISYKGAVVIEPKMGFYKDPVQVLDFNSLYPYIIIRENICKITLISKEWIPKCKENDMIGYSPEKDLCFLKASVKNGILSNIERNFIAARTKIKTKLKKAGFIVVIIDKLLKIIDKKEIEKRGHQISSKDIHPEFNQLSLPSKKLALLYSLISSIEKKKFYNKLNIDTKNLINEISIKINNKQNTKESYILSSKLQLKESTILNSLNEILLDLKQLLHIEFKRWKDLKNMYNAWQTGIKLVCNCLYGLFGVEEGRGYMPDKRIAKSITCKGRSLIETMKNKINNNLSDDPIVKEALKILTVIYGDTGIHCFFVFLLPNNTIIIFIFSLTNSLFFYYIYIYR